MIRDLSQSSSRRRAQDFSALASLDAEARFEVKADTSILSGEDSSRILDAVLADIIAGKRIRIADVRDMVFNTITWILGESAFEAAEEDLRETDCEEDDDCDPDKKNLPQTKTRHTELKKLTALDSLVEYLKSGPRPGQGYEAEMTG